MGDTYGREIDAFALLRNRNAHSGSLRRRVPGIVGLKPATKAGGIFVGAHRRPPWIKDGEGDRIELWQPPKLPEGWPIHDGRQAVMNKPG